MVAERARSLAEVGQVAHLEERVAGVRGQRAEAVGPEHGRHHGPVAAARLAHDPAVRRLGERPVALVDEGDDLVAEVASVAPRPRRVDELAAAERGPGVHEDDDARSRELVDQLREVAAERDAVPPHVELAGQPLEDVDGGVAAHGVLVVAGRHVHPERPEVRVAERVAAQELALDDVLVEASLELGRPRQHDIAY